MLKRYPNEIPRIPEAIKKLQRENELYLYGNSEYALYVIKKMKEYQVEIKAVLVSKEYYQEDSFEGYSVYEADSFMENNSKPIAVVLGFGPFNHPKLVEKLCDYKMIDRIFILNGWNYLSCNHFCFPNYHGNKVFLIDDYYNRFLKRNLCKEYYEENYDAFRQTYEWLSDEKSKKTMESYLEGHIELKEFPMLEVWNENDVISQYFPEDIIHLSEEEVFVDCGAYTGDTLGIFKKKVRGYKKYYALEPDKKCFNALHEEMEEGVVHIPVGAWDKKENLNFSHEDGCGEIKAGDKKEDFESIAVDRLDDLIDDAENVTFIKMDIEGAELQALQGASEIIKKNRPKLAICVYHRREDLITIPQFIKNIEAGYKLYLRAHAPFVSEVVLYAICD